jgi:hypothetical protein
MRQHHLLLVFCLSACGGQAGLLVPDHDAGAPPPANAGDAAPDGPLATLPDATYVTFPDAVAPEDGGAACASAAGAVACAACCAAELRQGCWDLDLVGYACMAGCGNDTLGPVCNGEPVSNIDVHCMMTALTSVCPGDTTYTKSCTAPNDCPTFAQCILSCPN